MDRRSHRRHRAFMAGDPDWSISIALGRWPAGGRRGACTGAGCALRGRAGARGIPQRRNNQRVGSQPALRRAHRRPRPLIDALSDRRAPSTGPRGCPRWPSLARVAEGAVDIGLCARARLGHRGGRPHHRRGGRLFDRNERHAADLQSARTGTERWTSAGPHLHEAVLQTLGKVLSAPPGATLGHVGITPV